MSISLRGIVAGSATSAAGLALRARRACRRGSAQALNSAVPLFGSVTSIVSRLVSTWSGKWNVMNVEPGPQRRVDVHRRLDRAAARGDAHDLALLEQHALGVLGREVERLAAVQRRAVAVRLHAGVVRLEPAAGGEPDRVLGVERLERAAGARPARTAPARPRAARPRGARAGTASPVLSSSGHGHWMPPSSSSLRVAHAARASARASAARPRPPRRVGWPQSKPMRSAIALMIQPSSRASPGGSSALRTRCTRRSEFVTVPSASHHEALEGSTTSASSAVFVSRMSCTTRKSSPAQQLARVLDVGLGLRRVLADHVQRAQLAALHALEHLRQVPAVARDDRRSPRRPRSARAPRRRARCPGSPAACSGSRPCRRRPARCSGRAAG